MNTKSLLLDPKLFRHLSKQWKLPQTYWSEVNLEWSSRLKKSLGMAYPAKRLVRIHLLLKQEQYSHLLEEVVCHELAHLVTYDQKKNSQGHHNPTWQNLMKSAGYEPRLGLTIAELSPLPIKLAQVTYLHTCSICQSSRTSKKPNPGWRCINCQNAGLDGKLDIISQPSKREPNQ